MAFGRHDGYSSWVENAHTLLFFGVAIIGWLAESKGWQRAKGARAARRRRRQARGNSKIGDST